MGTIRAVLGPTNTGKTHYAIERMLAHRTGVIGLPLRLLAREVYERIKAVRGPNAVALITGEERIVPERARYWVATTEAMPQGLMPDFVAIDEIQLCADPERGHVFTERLLTARGAHETLFLGAESMRGPIAGLVPGVEFMTRTRLSRLTYAGAKKLGRLPPRSAIVGFSVDNLYAVAELMRRQKGGVAVVTGAMSPRARNAQVAMYQSGDVDYLVATDAIGMGLNLDVDHVAFSALTKFDGARMRALFPHELAQIAGRAGRGMRDGSFGVTGEAPTLSAETVAAIEDHRFAPVRKLMWRESDLPFSRLDRLIAALEAAPDDPWLTRAREADDLAALKALAGEEGVLARASDPAAIRLLWDVCRIPDFRSISPGEHTGLLARIHADLHDHGRLDAAWFARQVKRIDRTEGDIDTLSKRLAYIRTWTYVAQRRGWLDDQDHWRGETRAVEDRLSDALHRALTKRFVDRRSAVLLRRLKQKESLVAEVNDKGEVTVEGEFVGRLDGFRLRLDKAESPDQARTLREAALAALKPEFHLRADRLYNAPDTELDFTEQGGLMWGDMAVGKLMRGDDVLKPQVKAFVDEEAGTEVAEKVARRLQHFIDRKVATLFEPLIAMQKDEALPAMARGFAFRLVEALGIVPRDEVAEEVRALDQDMRATLRKHGVRFGQFTIFLPALLKPAPTRLRLVLASLFAGLDQFPESPPPGLVTIPALDGIDDETYRLSGYRKAGARAIRIDMLERLADLLRTQDSRAGFEANPDMLSITGLTLEQFADLMQGLGYKAEKGEREKVAAPAPAPVPEPAKGSSEVQAMPGADRADSAHPGAAGASEVEATEAAEPAHHAVDHPEGDGAASVEAQPDSDMPPHAHPGEGGGSEVEARPESDGASQPDAAAPETGPEASPETGPETEVFYTFTWGGLGKRHGGKQGQRTGAKPGERSGGKPSQKPRGKGKGKPAHGKGGQGGKGADRPRSYAAHPKKKDKPIDPDNPFAQALAGFKSKD